MDQVLVVHNIHLQCFLVGLLISIFRPVSCYEACSPFVFQNLETSRKHQKLSNRIQWPLVVLVLQHGSAASEESSEEELDDHSTENSIAPDRVIVCQLATSKEIRKSEQLDQLTRLAQLDKQNPLRTLCKVVYTGTNDGVGTRQENGRLHKFLV